MNTFTPAARTRSSAAARASGVLAVMALVGAALFGAAAPAQAHDQLIDSVVEQADNGEATALRLTFSNSLLEVGTEMLVTDESGGDATNGVPKVSGPDVTLPLNAPLPDGSYRAVWRVVSSDGHPIDGGFSFDISDGAASELRTLDPASDAPAEDQAEGAVPIKAEAPNPVLIIGLLAVGAGVAAGVVIAAVIMRARRNTAARDASQDSPEQE